MQVKDFIVYINKALWVRKLCDHDKMATPRSSMYGVVEIYRMFPKKNSIKILVPVNEF